MNRTSLLFLLLLLWLLLFWLFFRWCGCFPFGAGGFLPATFTTCEQDKIEAQHSIQFELNSANPILISGQDQLHLEIIEYLKAHENTALLITGKSDVSETTTANFRGGQQRADSVKALFVRNDIAADRLQTADAKVSHLDIQSGNINNAIEYTLVCDYEIDNEPAIQLSEGLSLENEEGVVASSNTGIAYDANSYNYKLPLATETNAFVEKTVQYLKEHPEQQLVINGYYHISEENSSIFPNLGIARANQLKNLLIEKGISARQFDLRGVEVDEKYTYSNGYQNGLTFNLNSIEAAPKPEMSIENIILYFPTGASSISLDDRQRTFFAELTRYLDYYPEEKVYVVGHTDSQGARTNNIRLGRNRAEFARDYLTQNGIKLAQIAVDSKGPDEPIADNGTSEGRSKNRRVEISVN